MKSESGFSFAIASQPLLQRFTNNSDKWINFELLSGSELCWSKVSVSKRLFSRAGLILDWSSLLAALDASLSLLLSSPGRQRPTIPSIAYHQITFDPQSQEKDITFESLKRIELFSLLPPLNGNLLLLLSSLLGEGRPLTVSLPFPITNCAFSLFWWTKISFCPFDYEMHCLWLK